MKLLAVLPSPTFHLDGGAMFGIVPKPLWQKSCPSDGDNRIAMTTHTLLVVSRDRRILVDPGIGTAWDDTLLMRYGIEPTSSGVDSLLEPFGLDTEMITDVVLTHLHFDHVGGCFCGKPDALKLEFPKARHHVQRAQWEWAHRPSLKDRGSYIPAHLDALETSGRLVLADGPGELVDGVTLQCYDGHTRAQQLCRVEAGGQVWYYGGDVIPVMEQLRLNWIMAYDIEPLATLRSKQSFLDTCLTDRASLIFGHDSRWIGGSVKQGGRHVELIEPRSATGRTQVLYKRD